MSVKDELFSSFGATSTLPLMGVERGSGTSGGGEEALNGMGTSERVGEPPRKRPKLTTAEDVIALRKRVFEHKQLRLKNFRDRFTEQLSELYFLQAGGNMMDYAAWRKRPPTSQLEAFLEARRPPPAAPPPPEPPPVVVLSPATVVAPTLPPTIPVACSPPPTPVVVAAVTPTAAVSAAPGGTVAAAAGGIVAPPAPSTPADEMVEKAKQEAYVAARVAELARAGLWTERRLPRVLEPPRPKTHWDYLLEEMAWLAQDFAHERKWKKQAAKKCARAVQKYFQDKAVAAQKAEKAQELQLKKIAAFAAKEIRMFWTNVEKLVEWKRVQRVERARKEALDEQLSYIVDRTERYSRQLAANMSAPAAAVTSTALDTPPSDDEFQPRDDSDDDEETIAAAEREAADDAADHRDELEALQRESHLDLGDLLPPGYLPAHSPPPSDYGPDDDSADDEITIAEQERTERPEDAAAELAALKDEAELDLDELVGRYAGAEPSPPDESDASSATDLDSDDDEEDEGKDEDDDEISDSGSSSTSEQLEALMDTEDTATEALAGSEGGAKTTAEGEQRVEEAASLAASLQPTGTTLSETAVGTPVPRLLRHALREYQHVGLHWLATMYARGLNGILADEMGLGKTIQTIALLAHLALEHRDWGPHLVVAPTSVVLNWEMEFKKWCPAFKILTYYGTIKERKLKRVGWTKANSFHVCITSYKLVVQDHQSFRRKKWKYLILDEAQNIKNFKSQRWQMLLNFQTERRLLLTGTPLQNSLLELWSLMHFLMPDVFASHAEFREWFAPVAGIAEGSHRYSDELVRRLHEVLRPFLLRRLKADVERQMPRKYEHVLMCRLSKRQRFLYDDFMSRAKTKESLASGNLLSVINVLMQLRKVCNHPDLFESRPVSSPLQLPSLPYCVPALALLPALVRRLQLAARLGGDLASLELFGAGAFAAHRARHLAPPRRLVEELPETPRHVAPRPPPARLRLHLRLVPRTPPALRVPPAAPVLAGVPPAGRVPAAGAPPAPPPVPPAAATSAARARLHSHRRGCLRRLAAVNERRCWRLPLYGADLRAAVSAGPPPVSSKDIATVLDEINDIIERFVVCWAVCRAAGPRLEAGAGRGAREWRREARPPPALTKTARATLALLHAPASRHAVAFPHPRLLQYDCGKLQTLDGLLRRLRAGGHRVLIFTQMTRVLDVLEAFLSLHGHTYLRLDGATRVDHRQPLVDRFNADPRVFAFILSTRSGGVGLNLTGADCVVFYDSDWNPTMDAQAQDRCHRIGQTRDVHVFRLVTAATVEENILRKAEQKRALGHLAIEDGHFTTSYLRAANIKELFGDENAESNEPASAEGGEGAEPSETEVAAEAAEGGELESALAAAEDEADAAAAQAARAEAQGDLAEFDESLPLDDERAASPTHRADRRRDQRRRTAHAEGDEFSDLMKQLTPVEKYAMRLVETSEAATEAERAALGEMRRQLREWEQARRALRDEAAADPAPPPDPDPDIDLTYSGEDARVKVWISENGVIEHMPMWCPPTPPSSEGDVYCESWARPLYRRGAAADSLLPPVRWRDSRAPRSPRRSRPTPRAAHAPPSLFERAGPRPRPRLRPPPLPAREHATPPPDWASCEDASLRYALRLQRLPSEPPSAHTVNWDWLADVVNETARAYRSPRSCRERHDSLADPERARRKHRKTPPARRRPDDDAPRPPLQRLDAMREATERRRTTPKRRLDDAAHHNLKHTALLADHGVDYETPPSPIDVATRRAERIAKEKMKAGVAQSALVAPTQSAAPQRIVVAAQALASGVGGGAAAGGAAAGKVDVVRRRAGEAARGPAPQTAQLLYRHQSLTARHHFKILHHAAAAAPQVRSGTPNLSTNTEGGTVVAAAGAAAVGGAALRTLQLQQLRRAAGRAPSQHVVLAHLAPAVHHAPPAAAPAPSASPSPSPAPASHHHHHSDTQQK